MKSNRNRKPRNQAITLLSFSGARIADADPVSSRAALALMQALVASGDKTSALRHARIYEALVQQELGSAAGPDPPR